MHNNYGSASASPGQPMPVDDDVVRANDLTSQLGTQLDFLRRKRDLLTKDVAEIESRVAAMNGPEAPLSLDRAAFVQR